MSSVDHRITEQTPMRQTRLPTTGRSYSWTPEHYFSRLRENPPRESRNQPATRGGSPHGADGMVGA